MAEAMPVAPAVQRAPANGARPGAHAAKQVDGSIDSKGSDEIAPHMLIFDGAMTLEVDKAEFNRTIDEIVDIAAYFGGHISKQSDTMIQVRVPSKDFRGAMRKMEQLGEVVQRSVQAEDVSEEYNDLDVRLKSMRATRERLADFLKQAKNIDEVLRLEQELSRLNGEIDRIEGRMHFLGARVAFSSVTVNLQAKPTKAVVVEHKAPPPPPARSIPLPIEWLSSVGLDGLLRLR